MRKSIYLLMLLIFLLLLSACGNEKSESVKVETSNVGTKGNPSESNKSEQVDEDVEGEETEDTREQNIKEGFSLYTQPASSIEYQYPVEYS